MKKILIFIFLLLSGLLGCATIPKEQREQIAVDCAGDVNCIVEAETKAVEQIEYDRAALREERHDKIRSRRATCKAQKNVWVTTGWFTGSERIKMERDESFVPRHAHESDFACLTPGEAQDMLRRMQGGW